MTDANPVMVHGLRYLATEIVVTRDKALMDLHPVGDMLLDGLVSQGYAQRAHDDGRYGLTPVGHKALAANEVEE